MVLGIFPSGSLTNFVFGYSPNSHFVNEIMEPLLWIWLLAFFTLKTVYQEGWLRTILKAAAVALAWMPILVLYRFVVFLATFYSI
ncbi:MAG: hypothetical protein KF734_22885 [Saprospiraceae bacterium]|nr:hypothetical protein [Saprospiraceae bacterium]